MLQNLLGHPVVLIECTISLENMRLKVIFNALCHSGWKVSCLVNSSWHFAILETKWAYINFLAKNFLVEPAALASNFIPWTKKERKKGPTLGCILVGMVAIFKKVVLKLSHCSKSPYFGQKVFWVKIWIFDRKTPQK